MSEKDPSHKASYHVKVSDGNLGRFKSSGIIVSTGTGSSGWLYGAKRMTSYNVRDIVNELKAQAKNN